MTRRDQEGPGGTKKDQEGPGKTRKDQEGPEGAVEEVLKSRKRAANEQKKIRDRKEKEP